MPQQSIAPPESDKAAEETSSKSFNSLYLPNDVQSWRLKVIALVFGGCMHAVSVRVWEGVCISIYIYIYIDIAIIAFALLYLDFIVNS